MNSEYFYKIRGSGGPEIAYCPNRYFDTKKVRCVPKMSPDQITEVTFMSHNYDFTQK